MKDNSPIDIYLEEIKDIKTLKNEEVITLIKKYRQWDNKAYEQLILSQQPLIISIVKKITNNNYYNNFLDLIEEWNLWLIKAIDKFELNKKVKFSTYATYRIKYYITEWIINNSYFVSIPSYIMNRVYSYNKISQDLFQKKWELPSIQELSKKMWLKVEEVKEIIKILEWTQSLDSQVSDGNDSNFWDYIEDENADLMINDLERDNLFKELNKILSENLNKKEIEIIKMYFWLDNKKISLKEIAKKFKVTAERIRKIVDNSLKKIKMNINTNNVIINPILQKNP